MSPEQQEMQLKKCSLKTDQADWLILFFCACQDKPEPAGILLITNNEFLFKLKGELTSADPTIGEIWREMPTELSERIANHGGQATLEWLESASNVFRVSDREHVDLCNRQPSDVIEQLYLEQILK
jgi:hypothetical protein